MFTPYYHSPENLFGFRAAPASGANKVPAPLQCIRSNRSQPFTIGYGSLLPYMPILNIYFYSLARLLGRSKRYLILPCKFGAAR